MLGSTPAEAKAGLIARGWDLGNVAAMLERAGTDAARPEWLEPQYGIRDGQYFLTEQQAQAILDLRLHKLTVYTKMLLTKTPALTSK